MEVEGRLLVHMCDAGMRKCTRTCKRSRYCVCTVMSRCRCLLFIFAPPHPTSPHHTPPHPTTSPFHHPYRSPNTGMWRGGDAGPHPTYISSPQIQTRSSSPSRHMSQHVPPHPSASIHPSAKSQYKAERNAKRHATPRPHQHAFVAPRTKSYE
jgi:hypothetical protein